MYQYTVLVEVYTGIGSLYVILNAKLHQKSHQYTFQKKDQRWFYIILIEQIKIVPLPQAGNLLFIDKVREKEIVFCYEETVYDWFSNLWMGR